RLRALLDLAALHAARGEWDEAGLALDRTATLDLGVGHRAERVVRARIDLAERRGDAAALCGALDQRIELLRRRFGLAEADEADKGAGDPARLTRQIVAAARRAAQIAASRLSDPERGWRTLQQALAIAPSDPLVIADLADLA